ncbi:MAG: hypothetical protein ACJAWL_002983 [Motiliproteus sp.]
MPTLGVEEGSLPSRKVPDDFIAAVERALVEASVGDLALFAQEARGFPWEEEGLGVIDQARVRLQALESALGVNKVGRVLLFAGHMLDQQGRFPARFAAEREPAAKAAIRRAVTEEQANDSGALLGIAGGACGGDILFHEVCAELGIDTRLYLALPQDQFVETSVQHAGTSWIERFDRLCLELPTRVLAGAEQLPDWLGGKEEYGIWARNNLWILQHALALGGDRVTLIALWDGERGEGFGGTKDMVHQAQMCGVRTVHLDTSL